MDLEKTFAVDCEYYFGNYNKVINIVEKTENPDQYMKFYYNLVMAQNGYLPDNLLRFQSNNLGTFDKLGPDTPTLTIKTLNELYWVLGDMTFCERATMLANVCSPNNRNIRMVKRLAEINLVRATTQQPANISVSCKRPSYGADGQTVPSPHLAEKQQPMKKPSCSNTSKSVRSSTGRIRYD